MAFPPMTPAGVSDSATGDKRRYPPPRLALDLVAHGMSSSTATACTSAAPLGPTTAPTAMLAAIAAAAAFDAAGDATLDEAIWGKGTRSERDGETDGVMLRDMPAIDDEGEAFETDTSLVDDNKPVDVAVDVGRSGRVQFGNKARAS